jgi:hypothetical protein
LLGGAVGLSDDFACIERLCGGLEIEVAAVEDGNLPVAAGQVARQGDAAGTSPDNANIHVDRKTLRESSGVNKH